MNRHFSENIRKLFDFYEILVFTFIASNFINTDTTIYLNSTNFIVCFTQKKQKCFTYGVLMFAACRCYKNAFTVWSCQQVSRDELPQWNWMFKKSTWWMLGAMIVGKYFVWNCCSRLAAFIKSHKLCGDWFQLPLNETLIAQMLLNDSQLWDDICMNYWTSSAIEIEIFEKPEIFSHK